MTGDVPRNCTSGSYQPGCQASGPANNRRETTRTENTSMTSIAYANAGVDDGCSKAVFLVQHLERSAKKSSGASSFSSFSVSSEKSTKRTGRANSGTPRSYARTTPATLSPSSSHPPSPYPAPTQPVGRGRRASKRPACHHPARCVSDGEGAPPGPGREGATSLPCTPGSTSSSGCHPAVLASLCPRRASCASWPATLLSFRVGGKLPEE